MFYSVQHTVMFPSPFPAIFPFFICGIYINWCVGGTIKQGGRSNKK